MEQLVSEREENLVLPQRQAPNAESCQEPESISQVEDINELFKQWQSLVKIYRAGGRPDDDNNNDDDGSDQEQMDDERLITTAHYDVMAEVVTKLLANRPSWVDDSGISDFQVSRQKLTDATQFVDYDKIDQVERDEEDAQQIMIQ